jgi:cytochrome bd-type quinol oxidase subunit 2
METGESRKDAQKRSAIYLLLTVGLYFLVGIIAILSPEETTARIFSVFQKVFTVIALLAVVVTRALTKDKSRRSFIPQKVKTLFKDAFHKIRSQSNRYASCFLYRN